ncbi:HAD family hydrolase [Paenibacillus doosanensis]|uniref:HAD family hydrolase n=1 Tax=Paenibacillus doosanensis TaxID=1229154 RepID=UPI0021802721|nr:HAD family hydrolase [Paenibacillus doosanensis]MCS7458644.1 HAD family hydrolase [Paenibacillus doosanensis]
METRTAEWDWKKTLFVSDLDGTLLNDRQQISESSLEALNRLIREGLQFTIATARSIDSVKHILEGLQLQLPVVLMNGVFIYDWRQRKTIRSNYLPSEVGEGIVRTYIEHGLNPIVYTVDSGGSPHVYYRGMFNESERLYIEGRLSHGDSRFMLIDDYEDCLREHIVSVNAIDTPGRLEAAYRRYASEVACQCHFGPDIYAPDYHWLEIASCRATKKEAVVYVQKLQRMEKLVCFGDNLNDLSMFEAADAGVAVSNAHERLRERATHHIESNNEDAVARFLASTRSG